jgi:voltage-gated sodium channel
VGALIDGLISCAYVMLLMSLAFYIYAVLGVSLFKENDPWHFANIPLAFESLFRAATGEDWTDIWYTNYYGCAYYTNGIYVANRTIPLLANQWYCDDNGGMPVVASLYFISFIMIASWILVGI